MHGKWQHLLKSMMQSFGNLLLKTRGAKTLRFVPDEYKCQCCGEIKPLNKDHFQIVKTFKYGFSTYCLECDAASKKVKQRD